MKNILASLTVILGIASAHAESSDKNQDFQKVMKQIRLKQALLFLIQEGAITTPEDQCPQIEPSLLDELRGNGTLTTGHGPVLTSICVVPEPK